MRHHHAAVEADGEVSNRDIVFPADDGFMLGGTLFEGSGDGPLVLISSATAVPKGLYAGFARATVARGARAALIYDYRGTGASPRSSGRHSPIRMKEWALRDFPAAAAALDALAPGYAMVGVGQSFGGQALGLSGIAHRFDRYAAVASMSGARRLLDDRSVWPKMNLVGLPLTFIYHDLPRWAGIGEPMPGSVFRDWARWCRQPNYFFDDPDLPQTRHFADVRLPLLAIGLTDDPWGTPRAVQHLMDRYEKADVTQRWIGPEDVAGRPIGHLGFFRSRFAAVLWPQLVDWLLCGKPMTIGREAGCLALSPRADRS